MYVLHCADQTYYCGVTTDLARREHEHNNSKKGAKYTKGRRPTILFYHEKHDDQSGAQKAEASFKKLTVKQKLDYMSNSIENRYKNCIYENTKK